MAHATYSWGALCSCFSYLPIIIIVVQVLMDDGLHDLPTKENIENAMCLLTKYSQPGDVCFVSFSGHGGHTADLNGDEEDGMDES